MKNRIRSRVVLVAALVMIVGLGVAVAFAENIDPFDTGDQYAWGENVGWLNAEPANCSDCGVEVSDTALTGYIWGENIGWINLSCTNPPDSCGTVSYGVTNDGAGNLAGYAWGENVGWISFSCQNNPSTCASTGNYGVTIDGAGAFSGYAWGENIGWISLSDDAPVDYGVVTSWCAEDSDCDGVPDATDNCPDTANAGQTDTDGDGLGDVCDPDDDNDGMLDGADPCPLDHDCDDDGYWDKDETDKGSDSQDAGKTPEHCDGVDNDGDTTIDEEPAGAGWDSDGDTVKDCLDSDVFGADYTVATDDDGDGHDDVKEQSMSTDELAGCPSDKLTTKLHDAWPPDRDHDGDADIGDVIAAFFGKILDAARYDARSDADADGDVDIGDVIILYGGVIFTSC